ncbi:MAG: ethanolamine ammonia-lyase subunit EutC [Phycisphaerae bacterium]|nr:ethanolamine ammonia-lyase subunit EutC [Tepidisphaeraceae bacterium]
MTDHDAWANLRPHTPARIALGRAGGSLPTREVLDFALAHALARDAVHEPFEPHRLKEALAPIDLPVFYMESAAGDRATYLRRPDLGRRLSDKAREALGKACADGPGFDLAIVLSDGLSALAAHRQIPPLLRHLLPLFGREGIRVAPLSIVPLARVAIEDEVGELMGARAALVLLGERPGLGSPDSLGAYLVFGPRVGNTDARRNCVSNIRPEGLAPEIAAEMISYLVVQSLRRQISGVGLKDERGGRSLE